MKTKEEPQRIYLKNYQAPHFQILSVDLHFDLHESKTLVRNLMKFETFSNQPIEFDGLDFKLVSVKLNQEILNKEDLKITDRSLTLQTELKKFDLEIVTEISPETNTSLEGLYLSRGIFTTQCEAQGFRKITYFPDRPDVMTSFHVTIEADEKKYPVLLSNGDRLALKSLGQGRHQATWRDPHKKPCYLFALVAGDLGVIQDTFTTKSGRKVLLEVFAAHGLQGKCHHALESLKKSMAWDEIRFGREYDLNNYMIVAIDDFNAGAMENKGLNIFNSRLVLADPETATDTDYHAIESVVAHEYFHNWTGNRITLRDWFQLSLKEGLTVFRDQEFSADMTDRGLQRILDVDSLRERQFSEDASPNAHPVRPESCLSVDNFFTPTIYEKGAELIRMMQILTGRQGFRLGMDHYFEKFDGQAVTTDDFAAAISEPNQLDFTQFKLWYEQPGTPLVEVLESFDPNRGIYSLTLKQSCRSMNKHYSSERPFYIPVLMGLLNQQGQEISLKNQKIDFNSDGEAVLHFRQAEQTWEFTGLKEKPIPSLFREFSSPINLKWNVSENELLTLVQYDRDGFNRREMSQKIYTETILKQIKFIESGSNESALSSRLLAVMISLLNDPSMGPGFKSKMLSLPSDIILAQKLDTLNAVSLKKARIHIISQMAKELKSDLLKVYQSLHQGQNLVEISHGAAACRELKNLALSYLSFLPDQQIQNLISDQFFSAKLMTDKFDALKMMLDCNHPKTQEALSFFEKSYSGNALVMNKWFQMQALSFGDHVKKTVEALEKHPQFNINNPNNVYALFRAFGQNLVAFHSPTEDAYEFFLKKIEEIDPKNPQVAARLCGSLNIINKLPSPQKEHLKSLVQKLLVTQKLSANSRELLESL